VQLAVRFLLQVISTTFPLILWHLQSNIYVSNYVGYIHTSVTMLSGICSGLACAGKVSNVVISVLIQAPRQEDTRGSRSGEKSILNLWQIMAHVTAGKRVPPSPLPALHTEDLTPLPKTGKYPY
jgi:hypothetical protein